MLDWSVYLLALGWCALMGLGGWLYGLRHDDVSGVDSLWSLMFLAVAVTYFLMAGNPGGRTLLVLLLVAAWLDVIDTQLAVDLVVWSGIGLLLVLGYAGGRLGGATPRGAVMHGVLLASLGVVVLAVKSLH